MRVEWWGGEEWGCGWGWGERMFWVKSGEGMGLNGGG